MAKSGSWKAPKISMREHLAATRYSDDLGLLRGKVREAESARKAGRKYVPHSDDLPDIKREIKRLEGKTRTARSEARTADRKKAGVVASPRKVRAAIKKKK